MEIKQLTQEELNQLKSIQESRAQLTEQFGLIETKIQEFEIQKEILKSNLKTLLEKESKIGIELQQKYGNGSIDLDKGEFISQ